MEDVRKSSSQRKSQNGPPFFSLSLYRYSLSRSFFFFFFNSVPTHDDVLTQTYTSTGISLVCLCCLPLPPLLYFCNRPLGLSKSQFTWKSTFFFFLVLVSRDVGSSIESLTKPPGIMLLGGPNASSREHNQKNFGGGEDRHTTGKI